MHGEFAPGAFEHLTQLHVRSRELRTSRSWPFHPATRRSVRGYSLRRRAARPLDAACPCSVARARSRSIPASSPRIANASCQPIDAWSSAHGSSQRNPRCHGERRCSRQRLTVMLRTQPANEPRPSY
jgi:hypothetical protein